jgi:hypothetical protein
MQIAEEKYIPHGRCANEIKDMGHSNSDYDRQSQSQIRGGRYRKSIS